MCARLMFQSAARHVTLTVFLWPWVCQWADFWLCSAQAPWSEFMQDDAAKNNATRLFCTEALQIDVPHERMSDR